MKLKLKIVFLVFALFFCVTANAVQTIQWDKKVIPVELIVGVEQLIQFDGSATVGIPASLYNENIFRHMFASDTAYWKALQPFDKQRVKVRLDDTGELLMFDVSARAEKWPPKSVEMLSIVTPGRDEEDEMTSVQQTKKDITFFDLIRYAAQTDNSPERVVSNVSGIHTVENKVTSELSSLYIHADGVNVDMFVLQGWGVDGWYVTAIEVRNRTAKSLIIDPSRMQHTAHRMNGISNHFIASAMIRRNLSGRGSPSDRSIIYVVTDRPFASVIKL